MMMKNPKKRPSVKEIVSTHFVISHISKLLSHTLKMGKGGAESAIDSHLNKPRGGGDEDYSHIDPEAVDRNIERERERQKREEVEKMKSDRDYQVLDAFADLLLSLLRFL
jgi:hypothetical protein